MIFGRMPSFSTARRSRRGVLAAVAVTALAFVLAGCGGGGGDDDNGGGGNGGGNNGNRATVTGRLVNGITGEGVAGATVQYVTASGTTTGTTADGSDPSLGRGVFVLRVPAGAAGVLRITAPGYYPFGVYNNLTFRLVQDGVTVPATAVGQQVDLGNIRLYSTDGPPPPPAL
jgi:hypothetical protein